MSDQARQGLLSPFLRRRRMQAARPFISGRVLDFACGGGDFAPSCDPVGYLGCDIDAEAVEEARQAHPRYQFDTNLPNGSQFDTVVALAFIEHVPDPAAYARLFVEHLAPDGRIVLTTPHPVFHRAHDLGAAIGVFSRDASEEHEKLLGRRDLEMVARSAGLLQVKYRRFLGGANQLVVWQRDAASRAESSAKSKVV